MTQEDKELFLKDLCPRLPWGVQIFVESDKYTQATLLGVDIKRFSVVFGGNNWSSTSNIEGQHTEQYKQIVKPYLRPMSSMTDEEKKELEDICTMYNSEPTSSYEHFGIEVFHISRYGTNFETDYTVIDWLNAHHFDYRGLIEKGLALEAPEGMYKK